MWLEEQQAGQPALERRVRHSMTAGEFGAIGRPGSGRALQAVVGSLDFSPWVMGGHWRALCGGVS